MYVSICYIIHSINNLTKPYFIIFDTKTVYFPNQCIGLTTFRDFRHRDNDFTVVSKVVAIVCYQVAGNSGRCMIL